MRVAQQMVVEQLLVGCETQRGKQAVLNGAIEAANVVGLHGEQAEVRRQRSCGQTSFTFLLLLLWQIGGGLYSVETPRYALERPAIARMASFSELDSAVETPVGRVASEAEETVLW